MSDNLTMWSLIVGFLSPVVISIIQQPSWQRPLRAVVTFLWAVIVGAATAYFSDEFGGRSIVSSVLFVLVTAIATYNGLWKRTGIAPAIEGATSFPHREVSTESGTT